MVTAVYAGTFDPVTNGHLDIVQRAAALFDEIVVAVNDTGLGKSPLFSIEERVEMVKQATRGLPNVRTTVLKGLLVDCARECGAKVIVKGLRAVSDFETELQMALMNRNLSSLETTFLMTSLEHLYLSSSVVKEIAQLGGKVDSFVPELVAGRLRERFAKRKQ